MSRRVRRLIRLAIRLATPLPLAATVAVLISGAASAQLQLGPSTTQAKQPVTHHGPVKRPHATKKPAPESAVPPAAAATAAGGTQPDLAFGAFQRGYYITAFSQATQRMRCRRPGALA